MKQVKLVFPRQPEASVPMDPPPPFFPLPSSSKERINDQPILYSPTYDIITLSHPTTAP